MTRNRRRLAWTARVPAYTMRSAVALKLQKPPWEYHGESDSCLFIPVTRSFPWQNIQPRLTRYVGEQLGLHVGSSVPRHFLIPSGTETFLEEEDREYLKAKGVFTLPQNDTCAALLRVYLSHVHPVYPVIEVEQLWDCYHNGRLGQYNLLLLWSIFSVAVNVKRLSRTHPSLTDQKSVVYLVSGFRTRGVQVSTAYEGRHVLSSKGTQPPRPVIHFASIFCFLSTSHLTQSLAATN